MNVSSVKNLNGESFSAVQDAALTDVVQTNSGNWQDITAYQNASAGYLTAHQDLSPYYTTADANTLSGMLSGAIDYVSANVGDEFPASANEAITAYQNASGTYLTAVDLSDKLDTSSIGFGYDLELNTYVTGISGNRIVAEYADKAYQDISGRDITTHYSTTADLALKQDTLTFDYDEENKISAINNSALAGGSNFSGITYTGSFVDEGEQTVNYTAVATGISTAYDGVIGQVKFTSGNNSNINKYLMATRLGNGTIASGTEGGQPFEMSINPRNTPFTYTAGIFSPLKYATGACLTYGSTGSPGWSVDTATNQYYGAFFKGNEIFISNAMTSTNQALRLETHQSRGVHISGSNMRSNSYFDVSVNGLKFGKYNTDTSSWETCNYNKDAYNRWNEVSSKIDTSALEYNAVDEISGIAGSAIAQYGAEKQWLQHDDTIVHVANSAQYAFGVNVSAIAQLLGVDETVLYEGTQTFSATLSESVKNFNKILIEYGSNNYFNVPAATFFTDKFSANDALRGVHLDFVEHNGSNVYCFPKSQTFKWNNTFDQLDAVGGLQYRVSGNAIQNELTGNQLYIRKIVGIGRKA